MAKDISRRKGGDDSVTAKELYGFVKKVRGQCAVLGYCWADGLFSVRANVGDSAMSQPCVERFRRERKCVGR